MKKIFIIVIALLVMIIIFLLFYIFHNSSEEYLEPSCNNEVATHDDIESYLINESNVNNEIETNNDVEINSSFDLFFDWDNVILRDDNFVVREHSLHIRTWNITVDIRYPAIGIDSDNLSAINYILTPQSHIRGIYEGIINGSISLDERGELQFHSYTDDLPYDFCLTVKHGYTLGFINSHIINMYINTFTQVRTGRITTEAIIIDVQAGERISWYDFFDIQGFREAVNRGYFWSTRDEFNIIDYFANVRDESLHWYLGNAFINSERQIEIRFSSARDDSWVIIYATIDDAEIMITPVYLNYLD